MTIDQTVLDVCEEALYNLRQDVSLPTPETASADTGMEWTKCRKAIGFAVSEILATHDWTWARGSSTAATSLAAWPAYARKILVYCLARELAVQIAGRTEDLKNLDALYSRALKEGELADLDAEAIPEGVEGDAVELIRGEVSFEDRVPRSFASFVARAVRLRPMEEREILSSYPWTFAKDGFTEFDDWPEGLRRVLTLKLAADLARTCLSQERAAVHEALYRDALAEEKLRDARATPVDKERVWGGNHYVAAMTREGR